MCTEKLKVVPLEAKLDVQICSSYRSVNLLRQKLDGLERDDSQVKMCLKLN